VSRNKGVSRLELARGKVNAIDVELLDELGVALERLEHDDGVRAVVLTGAGRVFSAGVDLRGVVDGDAGYAELLVAGLRLVFAALLGFPQPTVAAVNGAAAAGGSILACACDRRVMADGAPIGASELVVGMPIPVYALEILRYACGSDTEDLVHSGQLLDAQEALAVGLVHEVHPAHAVLERAVAGAVELGARAPRPYRPAKKQLRRPARERMRSDAGHLGRRGRGMGRAPHGAARATNSTACRPVEHRWGTMSARDSTRHALGCRAGREWEPVVGLEPTA
jgi:enoyl-CoA hydratase